MSFSKVLLTLKNSLDCTIELNYLIVFNRMGCKVQEGSGAVFCISLNVLAESWKVDNNYVNNKPLESDCYFADAADATPELSSLEGSCNRRMSSIKCCYLSKLVGCANNSKPNKSHWGSYQLPFDTCNFNKCTHKFT